MSTEMKTAQDLIRTTEEEENILEDPQVAHLFISGNEVVGARDLPGLEVKTRQIEEGVDVKIKLNENVKIEKPVHMCFGVIPETGVQKIVLNVELCRNSYIDILAHCTFPFAKDVRHIMDAEITVGEGASYKYTEKHIHSSSGGVKVYPEAKIHLKKNANFKTDFELLKGRVGLIDINYQTVCEEGSTMEMTARVDGKKDDKIRIREIGHLKGENSTGVLITRVSLRDDAMADVYNELIADAPYARGHVDCKEIVQNNGRAKAVPVVEVNHPRAHVTHEAAIGSVDSKQLQTLMSRGLNEDEATDLIIQGILS
ncbi:MAG: SufB/SufD family protein [Elusimicrobiota bacterium]